MYSWQGKVDAFTCQGGKLMDQPSFLHPDNHLHKADVLSCWGGERMGRPSFSPPPKKQRLFAYSWQGMVDIFTSRRGERMGRPSFSPPRYPSAQGWCFHFSRWGKNGPAQFFPTPIINNKTSFLLWSQWQNDGLAQFSTKQMLTITYKLAS